MLQRVFNQVLWPEAGDVDDCWVLAAIQAVDAVAPWLNPPNVAGFRAAAGKPDQPGVNNGGNELDMAKGIRGIYALIGPLIEVVSGGTWAAFTAQLKAGRPAAVVVNSAKLPAGLQYGFTGIHATAVDFVGGIFRIDNPLAPAYSWPKQIAEADLKAAITGYQGSVHGVLMPTEVAAFATHPLYAGALITGRRLEYDAVTKAIGPRP